VSHWIVLIALDQRTNVTIEGCGEQQHLCTVFCIAPGAPLQHTLDLR
jgi:hypothetical protein